MLSKNVIGLDIGSKYIKIAFIKKGKKLTVLNTIYAATPTDSVVDGEIRNVGTVTARIRSALFEYKFKPTELYISINTQNVVAREIKLPNLSEKEIDPAIEFELMQSFPGIIQTHTISSRIYSEPGMPVEGITVFCPNKVLNDFVEVAKGLVIPLKGIDVNANAIAKAAYHYLPNEQKNDTMLIVDIGYTMSQVNLVSAGKLILSRQIQSGIVRFDNLVANRIGISLDQAERARQNNKYDIYNLDKEDIDGFTRIAFSSVEEQIRSIIDYYRYSKSEDNKISSILLFTGRGLESELTEYLGESFGLPVNKLNLNVKDSSDPYSDIMAVAAIGAVLEPQGGKKDINLIPKLKEMKAAGLRRIKLTRALIVIAIMGVLALIGYGGLKFLTIGTTNEIMQIQSEIIEYSVINDTKAKLESSRTKLANANAVIDDINNNHVSNIEILDNISKVMPDTIFIISLSTSDGSLNLSGVSKDRQTLADFIFNLKQIKQTESIALSSISARAGANGEAMDYNFSLAIKLTKAGAKDES